MVANVFGRCLSLENSQEIAVTIVKQEKKNMVPKPSTQACLIPSLLKPLSPQEFWNGTGKPWKTTRGYKGAMLFESPNKYLKTSKQHPKLFHPWWPSPFSNTSEGPEPPPRERFWVPRVCTKLYEGPHCSNTTNWKGVVAGWRVFSCFPKKSNKQIKQCFIFFDINMLYI